MEVLQTKEQGSKVAQIPALSDSAVRSFEKVPQSFWDAKLCATRSGTVLAS